MSGISQDASAAQEPGKSLVVINERLQELALVPGIDKKRVTLGEKVIDVGASTIALGIVGIFLCGIVESAICGPGAVPVWADWIFGLAGSAIPIGAVTAVLGGGLKTKADERHLALQDERRQLLLEQSDALKRQQQEAEQKQQAEAAEKHRLHCERLKTAAAEKLASLTDDDRHQGFISDLSDPDDPSNVIKLGITEVATYRENGQKFERLTVRLYQPVESGELLKAPEIKGVGPIHSQRQIPESGFPQLGGLRRPGFPVLASQPVKIAAG